MNLNLDEHFDHMDLDIPHISPTPERIIEPILKPIETPIELAPTSLVVQPIVTHPNKESTHREPPTTKEKQAPSKRPLL